MNAKNDKLDSYSIDVTEVIKQLIPALFSAVLARIRGILPRSQRPDVYSDVNDTGMMRVVRAAKTILNDCF